jgi:hypothetical protein
VNVHGCYVTTVMLANLGREPIRREDLAKSDPLRLEISNAKVLDIAEAGVTRKVIGFELSAPVDRDGVVTAEVTFAFLDHQDAAQIRVLTESPRAKIRVLGTVVGMPDGIGRLGRQVRYSKLRNFMGWSLITAVFAVALWSGVSVFHNAVGSWDLWWVLLLPLSMLIFPAIIAVAIGMTIWPGGSPAWPPGLQHEHRWEPAFPVPNGDGWVLMELGPDDVAEDSDNRDDTPDLIDAHALNARRERSRSSRARRNEER